MPTPEERLAKLEIPEFTPSQAVKVIEELNLEHPLARMYLAYKLALADCILVGPIEGNQAVAEYIHPRRSSWKWWCRAEAETVRQILPKAGKGFWAQLRYLDDSCTRARASTEATPDQSRETHE